MKRAILLSAAALSFASASASPVSATLRYAYNERVVYVDYTLTSPAIVTFDMQTNVVSGAGTTNWVSIGFENYHSVSGALNRLVSDVGVQQTIRWEPFEDWPVRKVQAGTIRAVVTAWSPYNPPDYCVININRNDSVTPKTIQDRVRYYRSEAELPYGGLANSMYWTTHMVMRRVHAAGQTFRMGSPWTECQGESNYGYRIPNEEPTAVTFSRDYWMAIFPMTCRQAANAFGNSGNHSNGDKGPMTGRKWSEFRISSSNGGKVSTLTETAYDWPNNGRSHAVGDDSWFGKMKSVTGIEFDLPTEAQWEFACRAGTTTPYNDGVWDSYNFGTPVTYTNSLDKLGWYNLNSGSAVHPVMEKAPNAWGFYDMHGNVLEMCLDHYPVASGSYNMRPVGISATDYPGESTGTKSTYDSVEGYRRVVKGGKYSSEWKACRSASRMDVCECASGNPGENAVRPVAALGFAW